jgi:hypothetical protein
MESIHTDLQLCECTQNVIIYFEVLQVSRGSTKSRTNEFAELAVKIYGRLSHVERTGIEPANETFTTKFSV